MHNVEDKRQNGLVFCAAGWLLAAALVFSALAPAIAQNSPVYLDLNRRAWFYGRDYFTLRSGRVQMIVQADKADVGPALSYLLFDAQDPRQSARKDRAFNFAPGEGVAASALGVQLGNYWFEALGHRTDTRWIVADGIPQVEAVWWAGGIRVTERIAALASGNAFLRSIRLCGANLVGRESVKLHLRLPPGGCRAIGRVLVKDTPAAQLALAVVGATPVEIDLAQGQIQIGPLSVAPQKEVGVDTVLYGQIPAADVAAAAGADNLRKDRCAAALRATRQRWAATSSLVTDDRLVADIFDKARFGLPGMIADDGSMDAGIFEYGAQWVRDSSNTALGAIHAGEFELALDALTHVLAKMVAKDGTTMVGGGFDRPDQEEFDQMGELLDALKAYRDWTGDDSLVRGHREALLAMIERVLEPRFRDATGMVHNRREFWERTFTDAYELAYQTYVIQGLRDAADLAPALGAEDRAARWRAEADRTLHAMLSHPTLSLVHDGRLIKRRKVSGEVADDVAGLRGGRPDVPLATERQAELMPDASMALPLALGVVDPRSDLARRTLDDLESLWNARWTDGGYDRYNTSSQPDQPGPWSFATTFILRAQHEARQFDRSRRSLAWLGTMCGGRSGAWFEEVSCVRSQTATCGLIPWTSAEVSLFVVRHYLGVRFEGDRLVIRPALYPGSPPVAADLRLHNGRLRLAIDGSGAIREALVNGQKMTPDAQGAVRLPADFSGGNVVIHTGKDEGDKVTR